MSGLESFFEKDYYTTIDVDPYQFILPAISLIYDIDLRRITKRKEHTAIIFIKALIWISFYSIYIVASKLKLPVLYATINFTLLALPCAAIFYTIMLIKLNCLSVPIGGESDINNRLEELIQ